MTPIEIFRRKAKLIEDTELSVRRQLSTAERAMLSAIFDKMLDRMTTTGGRLSTVAGNYSILNDLGPIYDKLVKPAITNVAKGMASAILEGAVLSDQYFRSTGAQGLALAKASDASRALVRERLGITEAGRLKAGGYLQDIIEDNTVRDRVRRELLTAVDGGEDIRGFKERIRAYLRPTDPYGETAPGPLERRIGWYAIDTLHRADRSINLQYAKVLGMPAAVWAGGLIETSRCLCQKLNGKMWTVEELEALDKTQWDGKDGSLFVNGGGFNCRHTPRWVGWGDLLLTRSDIIRVDGKAAYKEGAERQPFNECVERTKASKGRKRRK